VTPDLTATTYMPASQLIVGPALTKVVTSREEQR